ncbi:MAG: RNA methyltransferase [Alcaligenaceae bacterium]|nr:RNA methyltransferase [Alcaligenaceae bacterium]
MKTLASRDNPDYRLLMNALAGKRAPGERGHDEPRIALEGIHLCEAWLDKVGQPEMAFFDKDRISHPEVAAILTRLDSNRVRLCPPALMRAASQVVQGQGLIFLGRAPRPEQPARLEENCLWLDRVQDPGNMGTLLRTAAAAGIRQIYASSGCVAAWSPKVLRSAQGAHFSLDIHEGQNLHTLRQRLDMPLLVTALDNAQPLYEAGLPPHAAWVFGNEGRGVAPDLVAAADLRISIPQSLAVESLNVAVAAGICLFEQRRRYL